MIKALYFSKIKAFRPFLKVHQKFRLYSIICAMHIRVSETATNISDIQLSRQFSDSMVSILKNISEGTFSGEIKIILISGKWNPHFKQKYFRSKERKNIWILTKKNIWILTNSNVTDACYHIGSRTTFIFLQCLLYAANFATDMTFTLREML